MTQLLKTVRKRLFERRWYGRNESEEYIEDQYNRWNSQPPTRTRFCDRCGAEIRWYRETSTFSVRTGNPGHRYHLTCPHAHDTRYEQQRTERGDLPWERYFDIIYNAAERHYDSHEYRFREDDRESFDAEDLW